MKHAGRVARKNTGAIRRSLLVVGLAVAAPLAMIFPAAPAGAATSVSNLTVAIGSPSAAAGALTTYALTFKTSGAGALSDSDSITVTMPASTLTTHMSGSPVTVGATTVGFCASSANTVATCFLYSGETIGASTTASIKLNGVNNPTTANSYKLALKTSSDTGSVTSPSYTVTAAHALTNLTAANGSPSAAAGALTTYALTFKTSQSGGLSGDTGSNLTVTLPAGSITTHMSGSPITVGTTAVGFCASTTNTVATCYLYSGQTISANTNVSVKLNGVNNPTTANSYKLTFKTSSDSGSVSSPNYTVTAAHTLTNLTLAAGSPSARAGALTTYALTFKTSPSGGLSGDTGSALTVTMPAGTLTTHMVGSPVTVGANAVGYCASTSNTVATCYLYSGETISANTSASVKLNGINNPTTANSYKLSFKTSSDPASVSSPNYTVTAPASVTAASVGVSNTLTGANNVTYTVKFTATTGLSGDTGSSIKIGLPAGTVASGLTASPVTVGANAVGYCGFDTGTAVNCFLYSGNTIAAGNNVVVQLNGVNNPSATKAYSIKLSTTSDTVVKNPTYCIAAAGVPCIASFTPLTGPIGTGVTITGINLAGASHVAFHGTNAAILTDTATKITTKVPTGGATGVITVTTGGGTATSASVFTVILAPPISGFSPPSGTVGTTVTISGTHLANATAVKFHGVAASIVTDATNQITVKVPAGATTGRITVTTAGGTATSATNFVVH